MSKRVRVGLIGAGNNTKAKHIPGLRAIEGVEIVAVANRSRTSAQAVADEFEIPKVYDTWKEVIADPEVDAIVIGTWPNMHCEVTCAALEAGKHVLTEARISRNLDEARKMLKAAKQHPKLVAQVVPSPYGLATEKYVEQMIKGHYVGDLREVVVYGVTNEFWDYSKPIHWRQEEEISGRNILSLGILQETLMRWAPTPVQVFAQTEIFEPTRPDLEKNEFKQVTVPDSVQIIAELQGGVRALYHISGVVLFGPGLQIIFYGSRGTVKVHFVNGEEKIYAARAEDTELKLIDLTEEELGGWQVEADFIASIREGKKVTHTDFSTAVKYMEFLEAVAISAEENEPVQLPLA